MARVLILGRGGAAQRHERVLRGMGHEIVTENYDYVVIASRTENHARDLKSLEGFKGKCLVEKPMFMNAQEAYKPGFQVYVGYQLRFHPAIKKLRADLEGKKILSVCVYAGQSLKYWRGNRVGLLLDYSHELDLLGWVFEGGIHHQVSSENCVCISGYIGDAPLMMTFNYLDDPPRREWVVNTDAGTYTADLRVVLDDYTRQMHEDILSDGGVACTYLGGLFINDMIDGLEK